MTLAANLILPADADEAAWTATRRQGIGGSDVAAIAGLSKWRTPYALWLIKRGEFTDDEQSESAQIGHYLEPVIADIFGDRSGHKVLPTPGTLQHPEIPWMLVNVDRLVCDADHQHMGDDEYNEMIDLYDGSPPKSCYPCSPTALLECKSTTVGTEWKDGELTQAALLQVQHALAVTGLPKAYVCALIGDFGGHRFVSVKVERDEELIRLIIEMEAEFWRRVVENDPPMIDGEESTSRLLNDLYEVDPDKIVELDDSVREIIAQREQANLSVEAAELRKEQASNELKALLGDAEVGTLAGRPIVTWKESVRKAYYVGESTVRTLRVKAIPET